MSPILLSETRVLTLTNAVMGIACFAAVALVALAVYFDVRERRRWRASIPEGWPPPGMEAEDAPAPKAPGTSPSEPVPPATRRS